MRKPPTINDIAGALGMHKSTISLALSGKGTLSAETRQRIRATAHELGYEPNLHAQRLAHGKANATICLVSGILDDGLAAEKALRIQRMLNAHSQDSALYALSERSDAQGEKQAARMRQIGCQRPLAIVCAVQRGHPVISRELEAYQRSGGIVVTYDLPVPLHCDQVVFDWEDNAHQAARFLLEYGHWKIGLGLSEPGESNRSHTDEALSDPQEYRLRGFRRALADYDLTLRKEWFFRASADEKGGEEMAKQFLRLKTRPTAIAIANDYVAMAFMVEVMRAGVRVPDELSIIGLNNQPIAAYCPVPLTTMTQPVEDIARSVESLVLRRIAGSQTVKMPQSTVVHRSDLIQRKSVAVARDRLL